MAEEAPKITPGQSLFASISPALFDLAKLIIETVIVTAIRAAQTPPTPDARSDDSSSSHCEPADRASY
jgi:hypothetical protein